MAISLKRAVEGWNLHLQAERASTHTLRDYNTTARRFVDFIGPMTPIDTITPDKVKKFLAHWANQEITPQGVAERPKRRLSKKTILNMHTALSSLWTWAVAEGYAESHIIRDRVPRPKVERPDIEPLTERQILDLVNAAGSDRNRALLLFMLDNGARASEVCGLRIRDLDLRIGAAQIINGKGDKSRTVPLGRKSANALFRYVAQRPETGPDEPVFRSRRDRPLTRGALLRIVNRAGERAGITRSVHPHLLRHTFAISYLRQGGDVFTLQRILGHADLSTVRRYAAIAGSDVMRAHRRASPVDNLF